MDLTSLVAKANDKMEIAHGHINCALRARCSDGVLDLEQSSVYDQVVALRLLKKFQRPTCSGTRDRKRACVDKWLATEEEGRSIKFDRLPNSIKGHLYRAKALLSDWTKNFSLGGEIEFTPGESFESSRGRTSVYHKLQYRSHWTCTYDAFDDFAKLVYNTRGLKRSAKRLFKPITRRESIELLSQHESAYDVFKHRLEQIVTFTHGSRLSSVPKNNEIDRAINVETTANMLLQRQVAQPLRAVLASIGNDLELGQAVHRARIRDKNQATIDFSEASDRIWMDIVSHMYSGTLLKYLKRFRSEMVLVDDSYVWVNKLSSMGCGFTFEIMTMLFLSIARVLDPHATVYGDDVIIANEHAPRFIEVCNAIGLVVNEKKSFVGSPMRESCGAYFHDDYGYITGFDFHWCENWADVTVMCNKIRTIVDEHPDKLNSFVCRELHGLRLELLHMAPALAKGPTQPDIACGYLQCDDWKKWQKKCNAAKRVHKDVKSLSNEFMQDYGYSTSYAVCKVQTFKRRDFFAKHRTSYLNSGPRYLAGLLAGRYAPANDGTSEVESWSLVIVHPDSNGPVRYKEIQRLREAQTQQLERAEKARIKLLAG